MRTICLLALLAAVKVPNLYGAWPISMNRIVTTRHAHSGNVSSGLLESLGSAVQLALRYCQQQFRWDRWNCPEAGFFRREHLVPTRERAYVDAITAAGIIYSVTRRCSQGDLVECFSSPSQDTSQTAGWSTRWSDEDVRYGEKVAEKYLLTLHHSNWMSTANEHNIAVAKTAVRNTMIQDCKCHGVSGSCSMKTCWKKMVEFGSIAKSIHMHYKRAVKIGFEWGTVDHPLGNRGSSGGSRQIAKAKIKHLVYLQDSPNYCYPNSTIGWPGTLGRACSKTRDGNVTREERRSCRTLCRSCGYRVRRVSKEVHQPCNCSFQWCCKVVCDSCSDTVDDLSCHCASNSGGQDG